MEPGGEICAWEGWGLIGLQRARKAGEHCGPEPQSQPGCRCSGRTASGSLTGGPWGTVLAERAVDTDLLCLTECSV